MNAIQVSQVGGPEVLNLVDLPIPEPKPNEAVLQINAAGVNFIDVYYREGRYPAPLPFVPGQEAAGLVTAIGTEVTNVRIGERVAYSGVLGAYAEFAAVPVDRLVKIPAQLDFDQAAAAMLQGMTAHYLSHSTYPIKHGDTVLIHAAAGGVGALLVQMAKNLGARVIGTAGSEEKAQLARDAGADEVIIYTKQDFETETRRLTGGQGVHVVYDGVGKTTFEKDLNVLRPRGYLVLFGASSGPGPALRSTGTYQVRIAFRHASQPASLHCDARGIGTAFRRCLADDCSGRSRTPDTQNLSAGGSRNSTPQSRRPKDYGQVVANPVNVQ